MTQRILLCIYTAFLTGLVFAIVARTREAWVPELLATIGSGYLIYFILTAERK